MKYNQKKINDTLILRKAEFSDLDEIMRLEHAGFSSLTWESRCTFENRLRVFNDGFWVVSESNGSLHGYLCAEIWQFSPRWSPSYFILNHSASEAHNPEGQEVYVSSMTVDPDTRREVIGRGLFNGALATIFETYPQLNSTILIVNETWKFARRIYVSEGFEEIGSMDNYFAFESTQSPRAIVMRRMRHIEGGRWA